jgi:hypothetical protein
MKFMEKIPCHEHVSLNGKEVFLRGGEDVEGDERPGRPVTMKTDENVDKVRTLVRNDRHLSIRMIAEELNWTKKQ